MTHKDYVLLAAAIAKMPDFAPSLRAARASAASAIADALAGDKPAVRPRALPGSVRGVP